MQDLLKHGIISNGKPAKDGKKAPFSERYYKIIYREAPIDLFVVRPPADWGVIFTLRTGSREFSHWLATRALQIRKRISGGRLWERANSHNAQDLWFPNECNTEEQFLLALGLPPVIPPEHRYFYLCQICRYGLDELPEAFSKCPNCSAPDSFEGPNRLFANHAGKVYTSQA